MSAFRLSRDLPSYSIVPRMGPSVPRTVDTIMCFTLKPAAEWAVSTVHVVGPAGWARTDIERAATAATARNALRMQIYSSRKQPDMSLRRRRRLGRFSVRIRFPQLHWFRPLTDAEVEGFHEDREPHGEVDVALGNVVIEAVQQQ